MNVKRTQFTAQGVHIREGVEGEQSRTIAGYAIIFNEPSVALWEDDYETAREIIAPEAVPMQLLDNSDIKMTMWHEREILLARSNRGKEGASLSYGVDDKGVWFEFEAPKTSDGDNALELIRRGDIEGCSFAFSTDYTDEANVSRECIGKGKKRMVTYTVHNIQAIHDFTLATDPAYTQTEVGLREAIGLPKPEEIEKPVINNSQAIASLRGEASKSLI